MKYRAYPMGAPRVLTREQLELAADDPARCCPPLPWIEAAANPFKGFLLCRVCPPLPARIGAHKPLLPMRTQSDRLVFGLCRACAERCHQRATCQHTARERSWIAAYSHFELNRAMDLGYSVTALYEVVAYTIMHQCIFSHIGMAL